MERSQFTFYESFYKSLSHLQKATERARTYDAICRFALYGEEPDLTGSPAAVFEIIKPFLEASRRKSESGKKGGSKSKAKNRGEAMGASEAREVRKEEKVQEKVQEQYVREKKERFSPPESKEVADYIREKGYHIDPEAFVAFYASKGWKVGSSPMKDWKSAVVTWEKKWKQDHPLPTPEEPTPIRLLDEEEFTRRWQEGG